MGEEMWPVFIDAERQIERLEKDPEFRRKIAERKRERRLAKVERDLERIDREIHTMRLDRDTGQRRRFQRPEDTYPPPPRRLLVDEIDREVETMRLRRSDAGHRDWHPSTDRLSSPLPFSSLVNQDLMMPSPTDHRYHDPYEFYDNLEPWDRRLPDAPDLPETSVKNGRTFTDPVLAPRRCHDAALGRPPSPRLAFRREKVDFGLVDPKRDPMRASPAPFMHYVEKAKKEGNCLEREWYLDSAPPKSPTPPRRQYIVENQREREISRDLRKLEDQYGFRGQRER